MGWFSGNTRDDRTQQDKLHAKVSPDRGHGRQRDAQKIDGKSGTPKSGRK